MIATNTLEVAIYPRHYRSPAVGAVWSRDPEWRDRFAALGYRVAVGPSPDAVWVAAEHDAEIDAHVRRGGRLVLLPHSEVDLSPLFPHWQAVKVRARKDTLWHGD